MLFISKTIRNRAILDPLGDKDYFVMASENFSEILAAILNFGRNRNVAYLENCQRYSSFEPFGG